MTSEKRMIARWIRLRGLPLQLWTNEKFAELGNMCGGIADIDLKSSNLEDPRWVRLKLRPCMPKLIPKIVKVNDGKAFYFV